MYTDMYYMLVIRHYSDFFFLIAIQQNDNKTRAKNNISNDGRIATYIANGKINFENVFSN